MRGWHLTLLLLVLGILGCLLAWVGPARADAAERALRRLCPGLVSLAPVVAEVSRRQLIHPAKLMANVRAESHCRLASINPRTGAVGLGQILPKGSANSQHLTPDELLDPATNLDLTAAHLNRYLLICGTFGGAVHVYHGYRKCRGWKRDLHVLQVLRFYRSVFAGR